MNTASIILLIALAAWWGIWLYAWRASGMLRARSMLLAGVGGSAVMMLVFLARAPGVDATEAALRDSLASDPANTSARLALADWLRTTLHNPGEALALLEEGIALDSAGANRLRMRHASILIRQERWTEAARDLRCVLRADSTDANAWYNLGIAARGLEEEDSARMAFERSVALEGPVDAHFYLGLLHEAAGETTAALHEYSLRWAQRDITTVDRTAEAAKLRIRRLTEK